MTGYVGNSDKPQAYTKTVVVNIKYEIMSIKSLETTKTK